MKFPKRISDASLTILMRNLYNLVEGSTKEERKQQWYRWAEESARKIAAEITRRNCSDES